MSFGCALIDCEEDRTLRAALARALKEALLVVGRKEVFRQLAL